jgi:hypothetical protein
VPRYAAVLDACVMAPIALADRHVAAAAVRADAQAIVTFNMSDFPAATLSRLGLEALHPDDFLLDQLDLSPPTILQVIHEQAARTS